MGANGDLPRKTAPEHCPACKSDKVAISSAYLPTTYASLSSKFENHERKRDRCKDLEIRWSYISVSTRPSTGSKRNISGRCKRSHKRENFAAFHQSR